MEIYKTRLLFLVYIIGLITGGCLIYFHNLIYNDIQDRTSHAYGHIGERVIADELVRRVRLFCWILTMPDNHQTKAEAVKLTWASRCTRYVFISSVEDNSLPSIKVITQEGRQHLWNKTSASIQHIASHYGQNYDYFLKADDDTYVIVENLRKHLADLDPSAPFIMGRIFKPYVKQGYPSGGGGYVLSRAGLLKISEGLQTNTSCLSDNLAFAEDVKVGSCAEAMKVRVVSSLDAEGRECFHPFSPLSMVTSKRDELPAWIHEYNFHKIRTGFDCCSDYSITFHYVQPREMYMLDYLIYHLHPYGIYRDYIDLLNFLKLKKKKKQIK